MRSLVINLTRFGDLLQTQPAVSALAQQGETAVVCLANFTQAAGLLSDLSGIFSIPSGEILRLTEKAWPRAIGALCSWADQVYSEFHPDVVVNLTPSLPGRLLSRYWNGAPCVGLGMDELGFAANSTPWADFLQTASANRGCSPFNVVDLFRYVAGVGHVPPRFNLRQPGEEAQKTAWALLGGNSGERPDTGGIGQGKITFVGMQLGASEERRRWPLEYFVALGERLARAGGVPVLLGGPAEEELGQRYGQLARHHYINCIGKTSLPELSALLSALHLLVTNDTGTMHLAAGLGIPILSIFLCTAQPWDTGPYLAGSLCLEPDMDCHPCAFGVACPHDHACRRAIGPDAVARFALARLETGEWGNAAPGLRGWKSRLDENGFMALEPLPGQLVGDREAWIALQRIFYRQFFDGESIVLPSHAVEQLSPQVRAAVRATLEEAQAMATLLGKQALVLSQAPRSALKTKFLAFWQRLTFLLSESGHFSPLGRLMLSQAQEEGVSLQRIIAILQSYEELFAGIQQGLE